MTWMTASGSGGSRGDSRWTPQAKNQEHRSAGARSGVARRGRCNPVPENILYSQLRPDIDGGRLDSAVCMVRCGLSLPVAVMWLCKPHKIEDYMMCHATVVSRRTRQ